MGNRAEEVLPSGMNAMGEEIPLERRQNAMRHCEDLGLSTNDAWECIGGVAEKLEKDRPYEAMGVARRYLDVTGWYRIAGVLLSSSVEE